ncbi:hypothetical protein CU313_06905 [Prochlorococcus marinus str. MU1404]|uniref:class I SAM-dependent methyltransferase n=1 Tax=Prochlorococcus marinus TaxID=1219 RepID=UPI001ADD3981|nr:class I SAM-dependent methyltransferase [Prochlorococcus marinus]MBO8230551.1 class I SAM-dependent methyltransferase [Prochlorococcus marinus XMU1404]MBW3073597.1 hypothetical protein [Prochlorococcus marinus str. MU1404]MCR8545116.1 class I SAM-dependent methyltransferase [Prochlorococcus marinus CUG1432]
MAIRKVNKASEIYKDLAIRVNNGELKNSDFINGRGSSKGLTRKRIQYVKRNLISYRKSFKSILDVGCGDGSFLVEFVEFCNDLYGVLPSESEVNLTRSILKNKKLDKSIKVIKGSTTEINFKKKKYDCIICNGVFLIHGFTLEIVEESLEIFSKLQSKNGLLYIGEQPEIEEDYYRREKSILKKIIYFIKGKNIKSLILIVYHYFLRLFSKRIFYRLSENMFSIPINEFEKILNKYDYVIVKVFESSTNKIISDNEKNKKMLRRVDYLCRKK